jgi:Flp pilus assembly pilin Flp
VTLVTIKEDFLKVVRRLILCNRGVSMVEYAIIIALIALVCFSVVKALGESVHNGFTSVSCGGLHGDAGHDCSGTGPGNSGSH